MARKPRFNLPGETIASPASLQSTITTAIYGTCTTGPGQTVSRGDDEQRRHGYRELFRLHMHHEQSYDIRESFCQGLVVGREDFKARIWQMTRRQTPGRPGWPRVEEMQGICYVIREYWRYLYSDSGILSCHG